MVVYYELFGQKIGSHYLAMGVLGSRFAGIGAMSGGSKKIASQGPPINASSKDEENFIQEFLKSSEGEGNKGGSH